MDDVLNQQRFILRIIVRKENVEVLSKTFDDVPIIFGRGEHCHISFPENNFLSRTHGNISLQNNQLILQDTESRNGTLFAGAKINSAINLGKKGQFSAGGLDFFVILESDSRSEATFVPTVEALHKLKKEAISKNKLPDRFLDITDQPAKSPVQGSPKNKEIQLEIEDDLDEYTVVSKRLIKVTRDLRIEDNTDLKRVSPEDLTLQGVVTWGHDIFDVRQFKNQDQIIVGSTPFDPVFVPFVNQKLNLGVVYQNKGYLTIPKSIKWRLNRKGYSFSPSETVEHKLSKDSGSVINVPLILDDLCTLDLGEDVSIHFRYVQVPRPLVSRTWIENREEFKKAITISIILHFMVAMVAMFSAPKTIAPKVENVPARFAKLLVEPPKMILVQEPVIEKIPEPIVEKKPEPVPAPIVAQKKPPVVKKKPLVTPKPIKVVTQQLQKVQTVPVQPLAKNVTQTHVQQNAKPIQKAPPAPTVEDSFADAFATAAPNPQQKPAADIKINKQASVSGLTGGGAGKGLAGTLKSKVGDINSGSGGGSGGGLGSAVGSGVGQVAYAKAGSGGQVGKRSVVAAVLGIPKLESSDIPQGLAQAEVMSIVNKFTAEIHRCYERALFQDGNLAGRVEYEWNISPSGSVTRAKVTRSGVSNGEFLNNCVIGVFKKMKFPSAKNGQPTVTNIGFPFGKE
ncbi:MAG: AgmX/PglI C-terminal domain-containing protein [Pseudobdellovibrio sp.]